MKVLHVVASSLVVTVLVALGAMLCGGGVARYGIYAAGIAGMCSLSTGLLLAYCYTRIRPEARMLLPLAFMPVRLFVILMVFLVIRQDPMTQRVAVLVSFTAVLVLAFLLEASLLMRAQHKEPAGG
jgi:O-antigen/teichoic acid export membrane protein